MRAAVAIVIYAVFCACLIEGRARPRPRPIPQERRARPRFHVTPKSEDLVGQLVSSRWKWPLYPDDRPPRLGEWAQGVKRGEWVWRDDNISKPDPGNRWKPVNHKKPTGLGPKIPKKPLRPVKFLGPKKRPPPPNKIYKKPHLSERVDNFQGQGFGHKVKGPSRPFGHVRPLKNQIRPGGNKPRPINNKITRKPLENGNLRPVNNVKPTKESVTTSLIFEERIDENEIIDDQTINLIQTNVEPDKEIDGLKIYMFKGSEGIGSHNSINNIDDSKIYATLTNQIYNPEVPQRTNNFVLKPVFTTTTVSPPTTTSTTTTRRVSSARPTTPPPFPTRHTTPHEQSKPIVISQSSVVQNN